MLRIRLFHDSEGEPRIWSHGINESAKKRPGSFPWHGRWWLNIKNICLGIEWAISKKERAMLLLFIGEGDTSNIGLWIGIPFLLSLYLGLESPALRRIVPTVRVKSSLIPGGYWDMPITRWLGFRIFDGRIWIDLWADHDDSGHNGKWQQFNWGPANFFLGRIGYKRTDIRTVDRYIIMPEGRYPARITLYIAEWKRPRWPLAKRIYKADIDVPGGIPVPGKGENSWDMDDDAIYSMGAPASTIDDAVKAFFDAVMRDRIRHAAADWIPGDGWPKHMIASAKHGLCAVCGKPKEYSEMGMCYDCWVASEAG